MVSRKFGAITKRILAAIVMIPIAIVTLYEGSPCIEVLAIIIGGLLAWEWANMLSLPHRASYFVTAYIVSLAITIWNEDATIVIYDYGIPIIPLMIAIISLVVWLIAAKDKHRYLLTLGVPYISIGITSLIWIYKFFDPTNVNTSNPYPYSFIMTAWLFLMVWSMDIGGLVVGCNLRGPKLAPKISPNKTWSGLCGGVLLAVSVSIIFIYICTQILEIPPYDFTKFRYISFSHMGNRHEWNVNSRMFYAIMAIFVALLAQIGDLVESAIKRTAGVKDSSKLIPGHGGIFDRIDGLIFTAPFVYILFMYIL